MGDGLEGAASDKDGANGIDEVMHGIDVGGQIGPVGHGARRSKKSAKQKHTHHKEPHDEHGLLHGVAVVGDDEAERREEQRQKHGEHVDEPHRAGRREAIDEP